jgi:hypothetical protein
MFEKISSPEHEAALTGHWLCIVHYSRRSCDSLSKLEAPGVLQFCGSRYNSFCHDAFLSVHSTSLVWKWSARPRESTGSIATAPDNLLAPPPWPADQMIEANLGALKMKTRRVYCNIFGEKSAPAENMR